MREHISDTISQQVFTQNNITYFLISRGSLQEAPVLNQLHNIVEYRNRCINDFSGTRIYPRRSHRIGHRRRSITYTGIFDILRIEVRIIFREIFCNDGILKTDLLKRFLPYFNSFMDIFIPTQRKSIINVENNRFLRFYQFATEIGCRIRWFQIPSVSNVTSTQPTTFGSKFYYRVFKNTNTWISITGTHRLFRQQNEATIHNRSKRHFLHCIISLHTHADFVGQ